MSFLLARVKKYGAVAACILVAAEESDEDFVGFSELAEATGTHLGQTEGIVRTLHNAGEFVGNYAPNRLVTKKAAARMARREKAAKEKAAKEAEEIEAARKKAEEAEKAAKEKAAKEARKK